MNGKMGSFAVDAMKKEERTNFVSGYKRIHWCNIGCNSFREKVKL